MNGGNCTNCNCQNQNRMDEQQERCLRNISIVSFVVVELTEYLDTHPDDTEAFELFKQYSAMEQSAKAAYEAKFGPITKTSAAAGSSYRWLQDPWPWNYGQNEVK